MVSLLYEVGSEPANRVLRRRGVYERDRALCENERENDLNRVATVTGARLTRPCMVFIFVAIELMPGCDFQSLLQRRTTRRTMEMTATMLTEIRVTPLVWCAHTQKIAMKNVTRLSCEKVRRARGKSWTRPPPTPRRRTQPGC